MDYKTFTLNARAIIGTGWQRRWAHACSISESTVWRWANGHQPVPETAVAMLELMERADELPKRWRKG